MWNRRDQLQAYQFLRRRLVSAVLLGDANHPESPSRRSVMSTITGVVVTLLLLAGFAIWGTVNQSASADWRAGGQVIVEKDDFAPYVLSKQGGALHPALNYTSALLFLGQAAPVVTLSRSSIADVPRGLPIGIPGAPQALPAATALLDGPWTACTRTSVGVGGKVTPSVNVSLGVPETWPALTPREGLLVRDAGTLGTTYLIAAGRRFEIASTQVARTLGYEPSYLPVGTSWINSLPAGPTLRYLTEATTGEAAPLGDGESPVPVGQVITVSDPGHAPEFYVYRHDGLTAVSETEARLISSNPLRPGPRRTLTRDQADGLPHPPPTQRQQGLGYPDPLPDLHRLIPGRLAVCATAPLRPSLIPAMSIAVRLDPPPEGTPTGASPLSQNLADDVTVPATKGAVVHTSPTAGFSASTLYLITDEGRRYLLPDPGVVTILGYANHPPPAVPETLLSMLPQGPRLDQTAARVEWPLAPASGQSR